MIKLKSISQFPENNILALCTRNVAEWKHAVYENIFFGRTHIYHLACYNIVYCKKSKTNYKVSTIHIQRYEMRQERTNKYILIHRPNKKKKPKKNPLHYNIFPFWCGLSFISFVLENLFGKSMKNSFQLRNLNRNISVF